METKNVAESLLFNCENPEFLSRAFKLARIITAERMFRAKDHPELVSYISDFKNPFVLICSNFLIDVYIISPVTRNRQLQYIHVGGKFSSYEIAGKEKFKKDILNNLNIKDYLPNINLKQIIFIPFEEKITKATSVETDEEKFLSQFADGRINKQVIFDDDIVEGYMFSEYDTGVWTTDPDLSKPEPANSLKISARTILNEIFKEF